VGSIVVGESSRPFPIADESPIAPGRDDVPFQAHVDLLQVFLARRDEIVERIQGLLNAQRKPPHYLQDAALLSRLFEDCFFALGGITAAQSGLKGQLAEAHRAAGFKPREAPGLHNDLIDPAEMMRRGFRLWQQTRWPGRNGRERYASTLFNVYVLRRLTLLSMRLWDAGAQSAGERLAQLQAVLDDLWRGAPADQPVLVRDARWLIPVAQSPTTDELGAYFDVAQHVAESFTADDRLEIHKAGVRMAGGHLRSQLRHVSVQKGVSLGDHGLILSSRNSNALDFALLVQGLVPLLDAYEHAIERATGPERLELAAAICQGISADPELFVQRLDLLGPYSMIEHLFIATDRDGLASYTHQGRRHSQFLDRYAALIDRLAKPLHDDCPHFAPVDGAYSPYGVLYGFSSNLLEHMALKTLTPDTVTRFGLEDVFDATGDGVAKLAWVNGWRKLPHIPRDVAQLFDYPHAFAVQIFERIEHALHRRVGGDATSGAVRTGRLFLFTEADPEAHSQAIPDLPVRYFRSSDRQIVAAHEAEACDAAQLLSSRNEGELVVSYKTDGGWIGITKDILTDVLGAGRDAKIVGLPRAAAAVLKSMCPHSVVLSEELPPRSPRDASTAGERR
jgi:hypothetical protein